MFEVLNTDDAWDLGVLSAAGLVDGSASALGVPRELVGHFAAGRSDHANLPNSRVGVLACRWL
tara:strand:- start:2045 stop:2233 length:189 start_codon:yes stop_codon:yes gene_type:complete